MIALTKSKFRIHQQFRWFPRRIICPVCDAWTWFGFEVHRDIN